MRLCGWGDWSKLLLAFHFWRHISFYFSRFFFCRLKIKVKVAHSAPLNHPCYAYAPAQSSPGLVSLLPSACCVSFILGACRGIYCHATYRRASRLTLLLLICIKFLIGNGAGESSAKKYSCRRGRERERDGDTISQQRIRNIDWLQLRLWVGNAFLHTHTFLKTCTALPDCLQSCWHEKHIGQFFNCDQLALQVL